MPSLLDLSKAKLPEQVAAGILLTFPKWVCAQAASKLLAELTTGRQGQTLSVAHWPGCGQGTLPVSLVSRSTGEAGRNLQMESPLYQESLSTDRNGIN